MWKLTVTVPTGKLESVMHALQCAKHATLNNEDMVFVEDARPATVTPITNKAKKAKRRQVISADTALTMTGKAHPREGSLRRTALVVFEKLEVQHGIGNVSRGVFQDALGADGSVFTNPSQTVTALIAHGHMDGLDPGGVDAATYGR